MVEVISYMHLQKNVGLEHSKCTDAVSCLALRPVGLFIYLFV